MDPEVKKIIRTNVLALIEKQQGALGPRESSGVSRLMKLGMSNGVAQRILDDESDVYLGSLLQLAIALRVKVWELLTPGLQSVSMPFRNLDAFEAQLMSLYRQLPEDQQHEFLHDLSVAVDATRPKAAPSVQNPFPGVNRRVHILGHDPERRTPEIKDGRAPLLPPRPKKAAK